ncbi:MAG: tyrosinase family protein, partial [Rhizobacter sp.]|nr:tyrosinase family protein [Ferruginibacter sp.]
NWIGGDMASFDNSGNDMIFTGHHGNVDRVWEAWLAIDSAHQNPNQNDWREHTFYYTDAKGRPLDIKVKDLTNTEKLGYTFDDLNLNPVFCNPLLENDCPAMIESDQHTKVTATVTPNPGHKIFNNAASNKYVRGQLHFDRIELPYMPYCARVFFSYKDGDMYGAPNVQKYVGTFTILPIGKPYAGVLQKEVFFQIELDAGYANRLKNMEQVVVSLVPVALRNRSIPEDTIRLHSVKLQLNRS